MALEQRKRPKKENPEKNKVLNPATRAGNARYCPQSKWIRSMIVIRSNAKNAATDSLMIKKSPQITPPDM